MCLAIRGVELKMQLPHIFAEHVIPPSFTNGWTMYCPEPRKVLVNMPNHTHRLRIPLNIRARTTKSNTSFVWASTCASRFFHQRPNLENDVAHGQNCAAQIRHLQPSIYANAGHDWKRTGCLNLRSWV